jgi:hypothetical protein
MRLFQVKFSSLGFVIVIENIIPTKKPKDYIQTNQGNKYRYIKCPISRMNKLRLKNKKLTKIERERERETKSQNEM